MANSPTEATIVLVDPLPLRHFGLVELLDRLSAAQKVGVATLTPDEAKRSIRRGAGCRLIIYNVGGGSVSEQRHARQIRALKARAADVPLVILSDSNSRKEILSAFSAGAQGYLFAGAEMEVALQGLSFVFEGGSYFSAAVGGRRIRSSQRRPSDESDASPANGSREADLVETLDAPLASPASSELTEKQSLVLEGVSRGDPNKVIARRLGIREGTVKVHVRQIMRKLGVGNRTQIAIACRLPDPPRKVQTPGHRSKARTVGVMGDGRTCDQACALRAVTSTDGMTADYYPFDHAFLGRVANRIINEVRGINRVTYDITSKPPGTIEWE